MIQIRRSVFETNSSSSHSLAFSKKNRGYDYDLPVDEDGVLTITFEEFGWGPAILKTPLEKLTYAIVDCGIYDWDDDEKAWPELLNRVESNEGVQELIDIVKTNCPQVRRVEFKPSDHFYPLGYIDHESVGTSRSIDPKELIFSNDVIILIDNDNTCHFDEYKNHRDYRNNGAVIPAEKDVEDLFDNNYF